MMDVQAALNLLDQALSGMNGTRADHEAIAAAIETLQHLIDQTVASLKSDKSKRP